MFPFKAIPNTVGSDNEVDNDGLVGIDSALGVTLGTNKVWYFDHDQEWTIDNEPIRGSWYRIFHGPWEYENHDTIKFNEKLGLYLRSGLIDRAGPYPGTGRISSWSGNITRNFRQDTPKVIVFIHGKTSNPDDSNQLVFGPAGDPKNGEYNHFFGYWGFDQIARLLGAGDSLQTLSGKVLTHDNWNTSFLNTTPSTDDHFLVRGRSQLGRDTIPELSVMITFRDGSKSLIKQTEDVIDKIDELYRDKFGGFNESSPNIILLGHSMGGLVARCLLTAPSDELSRNKLSQEAKTKAKSITDKTLYLITLASPHQGSSLADKVCNLGDTFEWIDRLPDNFLKNTNYQALSSIDWSDYIRERIDSKDPATQDLRTLLWKEFNLKQLAPHLAARSDKSLVPVYCFGSRSPGGPYFYNPNTLLGGIKPWEILGDRTQFNATGQVLFDGIVTKIPGTSPMSWGTPPPEAREELDTIRRIDQKELAEPYDRIVLAGLKLVSKITGVSWASISPATIAGLIYNVPYYIRKKWKLLEPLEAIRELRTLGVNNTRILSYLLESYTDNYDEAAVWMINSGIIFEDVVNALVKNNIDLKSIAITIRDRFMRSLEEIARAFQANNASSYKVTDILVQVFNASPTNIAQLLKDLWGRTSEEILTRLKPYFGMVPILKALRSVHQISAATAARYLRDFGGQSGRGAGGILAQVGFQLPDIATVMFEVLNISIKDLALFLVQDRGLDPISAARILRDVTSNDYDIVEILRNEFNRPVREVALFLKDEWQQEAKQAGKRLLNAGYSLSEIVGVFKSVFRASPRTVAIFLRDETNESWRSITRLMKEANYTAIEIAERLKLDFSVAPLDIARELKRLFAMRRQEVQELLMILGISGMSLIGMIADLFS